MIRHYLASSLASVARTPFTTTANILTLALGLACFIAAWGVATYWQSADSHHEKADRTFVIGQSNTAHGMDETPLGPNSSWTLAKYVRQDFPEIEHIARAVPTNDAAVAAGGKKALLNQGSVDPDFLEIFDLDFLAGDAQTALLSPENAVLTSEAAQRLFGDAPALGKTILVNGATQLTVAGVIAPPRQPSFMGADVEAIFPFDFLRPWGSNPELVELDKADSWLAVMPFTFVALRSGASVDAMNARLPAFIDRRVPEGMKSFAKTTMRAFPLSDLATFNMDRSFFSGGNLSTVSVLLALAYLTLAVACVNYANLATAQAASRTKEIGMQRVLGAGKFRIMAQAWAEAGALTMVSLLVAICALLLVAPVVRAAAHIDILYFLSTGAAGFGVLTLLVMLVTLVAGAYPALVLSHVRPAAALRSGRERSGSKLAARVLVAIQFASASFLLILLTVTQLQRSHLEHVVLSTRPDPVVILNNLKRVGVDYTTLSAELTGQPGIRMVSVADIPPWSGRYNGMILARSPDAGAPPHNAGLKHVGYDYFETLGLDLLAGRTFDRRRDATPVSLYELKGDLAPDVIIDRRLAESLGFATPEAAVGQAIYIPGNWMRPAAQPVQILGVVETEPSGLEAGSAGAIYTFNLLSPVGAQTPLVRLDRDRVQDGIASIHRAFDKVAPNIPANIWFFDDAFEWSYRQYARISQLFILLASAAFGISSIGLVGIAVHAASRRRHEIAVRKTLGATVTRIIRLLLTDFSIPVLAGNLLAWPLGYLAAQTYLSAFAYRADITLAPFAFSLVITLAIAWAAIIGVVLKAASIRPAEVMRHA